VDTGAGKLSDKVIEAIKKLSNNPIQFIVSTSFHPDHVGGNVQLHKAGYDPSLVGSFFSTTFSDAGQGATMIGQINVQTRLSKERFTPMTRKAAPWSFPGTADCATNGK